MYINPYCIIPIKNKWGNNFLSTFFNLKNGIKTIKDINNLANETKKGSIEVRVPLIRLNENAQMMDTIIKYIIYKFTFMLRKPN
jgi:hypothetical protein